MNNSLSIVVIIARGFLIGVIMLHHLVNELQLLWHYVMSLARSFLMRQQQFIDANTSTISVFAILRIYLCSDFIFRQTNLDRYY